MILNYIARSLAGGKICSKYFTNLGQKMFFCLKKINFFLHSLFVNSNSSFTPGKIKHYLFQIRDLFQDHFISTSDLPQYYY